MRGCWGRAAVGAQVGWLIACTGGEQPAIAPPLAVCDAAHLDACRTECDAGVGKACATIVDTLVPSNSGFDACKDPALYKYAAEKGCSSGELRGCQVLGNLHHAGAMGLAQDDARAIELWTKGCDGGHGRSCLFLGRAHLFGWGLKTSEAKWTELTEKACASGDHEACSDIAWTLVESKKKADVERAAKLWQAGCDAGEAIACRGLGYAHETGKGVVKDEVKARQLMQKSCDAGVTWACGNLGFYLVEGMGGPQEVDRGKTLLERACKDEMDWACEKLGKKKKAKESAPAPLGECADPDATRCGEACVFTDSDAQHCGGCDMACPGGYSCVNRRCEPY